MKEDLGKNGSPFEFEERGGGPPTRREGHVLSLVALLGGGTAGFSSDISGRQVVRHSLRVLDQYSEIVMMRTWVVGGARSINISSSPDG
jgi:hypothetical protein